MKWSSSHFKEHPVMVPAEDILGDDFYAMHLLIFKYLISKIRNWVRKNRRDSGGRGVS